MKFSTIKICLLFLTSNCFSNLIQDIEGRLESKERILKQEDINVIKTSTLCDLEMIKAYGLQGIQDSIKRENSYCPSIRDNCCTQDDEVHSMNFWLQKIKGPLENRYRLYHETITYLLGFYKEAEELARDLEFQSSETCKSSARQFLSLSFDKNMINYILNELQDSLKKITDLRKGFYCMLCDAQTSLTLYNFWQTSDNRFKDRMYYSQDFCQNLVSNNLKAVYYVQRYVRFYLEYLADMIKCKLSIEEETHFEISRQDLVRVKNCVLFGDRFFFFFCEKFCEEFQITKISPIFDGYIDQLKPFYRLISSNRKNAFFYPQKNLFVTDVSKSEAYIEKQYEESGSFEIFAKSSQETFKFDNMTTDFVVNGGLNLHESVTNSLYELNYKSTQIVTIVIAILSLFQFKIQRLQFTMKLIFIFAYIIERYFHKDFTDFQCVSEIMQFYGFEGLENPISYQKLLPDMNNDYCPSIKESCCSRLDFQKTQRLWDVKALNIKLYLSKIFKSIQKITVLQSSLLQLAKNVREKDSDQCREVDFTFFNSPIKYNEVYFYLQNALEAFAYMQRGFYCMLCDASQHQFLAIQSAQTRRLNIISHKFCNDLVFFFREFLMFKVYYLDPLMVNTNLLFNCLTDTDTYSYNFFYNASYASLNDCLENGEQCEYTCKEFKFGTSGNLFIGRLHEYMNFIQQIEETISKFGHNIEVESFKPLDELFIDDKEYSREFFLDWEQGIQEEKDISLKFFNMTQMEIDVEDEGINLFDIAFKSNYFLTNSLTQKVVRKSFNILNPGRDKDLNGGTRLDVYSNENKNIPEIFNQQRIKQEQAQEEQNSNDFISNQMKNPNRPSKADLMNYYDLEKDMDYKMDKQFRDSLQDKEFAQGDVIDFGRAGEVPIHMASVLLSCFLSTIFLFQQLIQQKNYYFQKQIYIMNFQDESQKNFFKSLFLYEIFENINQYKSYIIDKIPQQPQAGSCYFVKKNELRKLKKQDGYFFVLKNWGGKQRVSETRKQLKVNGKLFQVSYSNIQYRNQDSKSLQRRIYQTTNSDIAIIQYHYKNNHVIQQEIDSKFNQYEGVTQLIKNGIQIITPQVLDMNQNQKIFIILKQPLKKKYKNIIVKVDNQEYKCFYQNQFTVFFKIQNLVQGTYDILIIIGNQIKITTNLKLSINNKDIENKSEQFSNKFISESFENLSFSQSENFSEFSFFKEEKEEKEEIQQKVKTIQKQVKGWISRNKYQLLKSTTMKLQNIYKKKKIHKNQQVKNKIAQLINSIQFIIQKWKLILQSVINVIQHFQIITLTIILLYLQNAGIVFAFVLQMLKNVLYVKLMEKKQKIFSQ